MYTKSGVFIALLVVGFFCITVVSADPYVTYNANGATSGAVPVDNNGYTSGNAVTVLGNTGNLAISGYTFNDWNTAPDGSGISYSPGGTFTIGSGNVTLYAQWTAIATYTVTYNANGATNGAVPIDSNLYAPGDSVTVLGNTGGLARTGYTFGGWNTAADGSGISYSPGGTLSMGSSDITLYAQWTAVANFPGGYNESPFLQAIGPDNPLYGLRIAMENLDESFTFNQSERLEKEIDHTDLRLSELENALADNDTVAINRTLDLYWEKFNETEDTLGRLGYNSTWDMSALNRSAPNPVPFTDVQNMLTRHEEAMRDLMQRYPDRENLKETYNHISAYEPPRPQSPRNPGGSVQMYVPPRIPQNHGPYFTNRTEQDQRQGANPGQYRGPGQSSGYQTGNGSGDYGQHPR